MLRTEDASYGEPYWSSLDNGAGYRDSPMWEDLAHIVKELFAIDLVAKKDRSASYSLLDVGCAAGYLVKHLLRRGVWSHGVDYSRYALGLAEESYREHLDWYDLTDTKPLPTSYSLMTCFETMEHIREDAVEQALTHMWNALQDGARALFTICTDKQPGWDSDPTHITIKPREFWTEQLTQVGFEHDAEGVATVRRYWLFSQHDGVFVVTKPLRKAA